MSGKTKLGYGHERELPRRGQPPNLLHIQLLRRRPIQQFPPETMQQVGQSHLNHLRAQTISRAHPPPRPEW